jgi:hypothetical protein
MASSAPSTIATANGSANRHARDREHEDRIARAPQVIEVGEQRRLEDQDRQDADQDHLGIERDRRQHAEEHEL